MKTKKIKSIDTPYKDITLEQYVIEKKRLQIELLKIQQRIIADKQKLVIIFEGRDAAGKGSTIKRFSEYLIPYDLNLVALGIPKPKEQKYWFRRYEKYLPKAGEMTIFDRSWYTRALTEPTMNYCSKARYQYFMKNVLNWEHNLIDNGLFLIKFYLSVDQETQLFRFEDRISSPLTYWKLSKNDLEMIEKWHIFTRYKEQMFAHTSSEKSPWIVIKANNKMETRLTAMLHFVRLYAKDKFTPLSGIDPVKTYHMHLDGVTFNNLTFRQFTTLKNHQQPQKVKKTNG